MAKISGKTKIVGIFGCPVEHSFSPAMHNAAFEHLNLNFVYVPFLVMPANLKTAVESVRAIGIKGVNVTVPHKENVIKYLDVIDEYAEEIGAINTIVNENGELKGTNTDAYGFEMSLKEKKVSATGKNILILGAGGAAKSVGSCIKRLNPKKLYINDIDVRKAEKLSRAVSGYAIDKSEIKNIIDEVDILINATPLGLSVKDSTPVDIDGCKRSLFVCDLVYNIETKLIKKAKKLGMRNLGGLTMLLYQGAMAFEIWSQKKAPVEIMRKALLNALRKPGEISGG